ncbi:type VI secretion system-associated protein [Pantoea ananatis]|uniref:Type VI secretion system baseplate subunit TssK n=1 Tax=Pantoea ananas TaxID=553 RepID=A0A8A4KDM5_PANAN|nr:type VI secretion system baseplate subunit TssK [Pantoea ananatis]MDC7867131.1 type VI secretion system-associated protein [Pantoea ananatis]PXW02209.1 type VI secretion system protein ImpJ [Pantoea ananatis]QTC47810.1 type VI secretion system baseplate subunit TssK [Pantoea ananatis]
MNRAEKVVWAEGMFLRPHHFQQAENFLQSSLREWGQSQRPYVWGFFDLEFDEALLRQGKLALIAASGCLPDGTFFAFSQPQHGPAPLDVPSNTDRAKVVLAIPARRNGREAVTFQDAPDSLARYLAWEAEVEDDNAQAVGTATVQFGKLRLRLMLEQDLTAEWTAMGVAQIVEKRSDNHIRLDNDYIPPTLTLAGSRPLQSMMTDLHGMIQQRSQQLSQRAPGTGRFNSADMVDFMLLALLNRQLGLHAHLQHLPLLHPETLYSHWLQLAAELATWTEARTPDAFPLYDHDDLQGCFSRLTLLLRQGLSQVMEESAIQLPLTQRSHGLNVATVPDNSMVREFGFVLAVKANVPADALKTHFPAQMKVAPVTKIRDLVQLQLPGLALKAMPGAPPQIPWHAGYSYFELDKNSELWQEMERSGAFALHLAGEFPGLNMEFWAIRSQSE